MVKSADAVHELTAETSEDCRRQPELNPGAPTLIEDQTACARICGLALASTRRPPKADARTVGSSRGAMVKSADAVHELTAETSEDCRRQPELNPGAPTLIEEPTAHARAVLRFLWPQDGKVRYRGSLQTRTAYPCPPSPKRGLRSAS